MEFLVIMIICVFDSMFVDVVEWVCVCEVVCLCEFVVQGKLFCLWCLLLWLGEWCILGLFVVDDNGELEQLLVLMLLWLWCIDDVMLLGVYLNDLVGQGIIIVLGKGLEFLIVMIIMVLLGILVQVVDDIVVCEVCCVFELVGWGYLVWLWVLFDGLDGQCILGLWWVCDFGELMVILELLLFVGWMIIEIMLLSLYFDDLICMF